MATPPMARSKAPLVVIAHLDGRRSQGYVFDFLPTKDRCKIFPSATAKQEEGEEISVRDLKAIFFLRAPSDPPLPAAASGRRKLEVIFADKERLEGTTEGYSKDRLGFFMVPEDPEGKIIRVFVVNANVTSVKWVQV